MTSTIGRPNRTAAIDPITLEVIGSALDSIVEEAGEHLVRASYSPTIKERRDISTALFDAEGQTLCQAAHIPLHLGSLFGVVNAVLKRHSLDSIHEGDVFISNDPYSGGGTHLNDIVLLEPIFFEDKLVSWTTNLAHHADFVDRAHAHIFQEGLRIPPVKLYKRAALQRDLQELILTNCQVPSERLADLRAQVGANKLAVKKFQALCARRGAEVMRKAACELMDYAERRMRAGIAKIPDGSYHFEDTFDHPEIPEVLPMSATVNVRGSDVDVAFDATPQIRASLNLVNTALAACTYYAFKTVCDPHAPANAGLFRPIRFSAPFGSILNCAPPAAVYGRACAAQRVVDLIHGALAQAAPLQVTAAHNGSVSANTLSGIHPETGKFYVYGETIGGGFGARATKDGLDGVHVHVTNTSNLPVEALETEYPLVVEKYELITDSGGPGKWRGGMGIHRSIRVEAEECRVDVRGSRVNAGPWGLDGGLQGGRFRIEFNPPLSETFKKNVLVEHGQRLSVYTPGAGGYGDPRQRDRDLVDRDLREERISKERAIRDYGLLD